MKRVIPTAIVGMLLFFLLFGFFYNIIQSKISRYAIRKNMQIVQGARISKIEKLPKSYKTYSVTCVFDVRGVVYTAKIKNSYSFQGKVHLKAKSFPIACEKDNFANAFILIKPEDFDFFEIPFPDSLNWIKQDLLK